MADECKHTVKYNGKTYAPGDAIEVKEKAERERLIEAGAIGEPTKKTAKKAEKAEDAEGGGKAKK